MRNRRDLFSGSARLGRGARARHAQPPSPRPRRPADVDRAARAGRAGPCPAQHHRPGHRRPADRQRGRGASSIVVNGEFYDFERVQRELEGRGHRLRTRSDSEIALHLYEDLGTALPGAAARRVRLRSSGTAATTRSSPPATASASSRCSTPGTADALYLASEAKALFAAGVPARWDRDAVLPGRQPRRHPAQDRSLFDGVYQVPPGHYLLATGGEARLAPLLGLRLPGGRRRRGPCADAEYAERVRAALDEAVRLRLRADVPVGCYLSGGLDSCAVLGLARSPPRRPDPRLHADLRPARLRRGGDRPRDGRARRGRVLPGPDPSRTTSPTTSPTRPGTRRRSASTRTASRSTC